MKHPWILGAVMLFTGCGQTGALYLPDGTTESPILIRPMSDAPASDTSPAAPQPPPPAAAPPSAAVPLPAAPPVPATGPAAPIPPREPSSRDGEQEPPGTRASQPEP